MGHKYTISFKAKSFPATVGHSYFLAQFYKMQIVMKELVPRCNIVAHLWVFGQHWSSMANRNIVCEALAEENTC